MTNPQSEAFWRNELRRLWETTEPLAMVALIAGAEGAVRLLPGELTPLVNWELFNRAAIDYLGQYRLSTIRGINETTRAQTMRAINDWIRSDAGLDSLRAKLRPIYGKTRADSIAITEVTRTFAEGNMQLWNSTGVVSGKRWMTAVDERVCPVCSPLHGKLVEIDGNFGFTEGELSDETLQKAIKHLGTEFRAPPAHPRCRCWLQPVVSEQELRREIGDILAEELFAKVTGDRDVFTVSTQTGVVGLSPGRE